MTKIKLRRGKLWYGDCLKLLPEIPDKKMGMIFADLPYGITACKWDVLIDDALLWPALSRIVIPGRVMVFTATVRFGARLVVNHDSDYKHRWVWDKTVSSTGLHAKIKPLPVCEDVLVFTPGGGRVFYKPIMRRVPRVAFKQNSIQKKEGAYGNAGVGAKRPDWDNKGLAHPREILVFSNHNGKGKLHPTQKPIALLEYLIKTYTNEGDWILDPTAGSGTTAIAAINTGRRYVCIEKDPKTFKTMIRRVSNRESERRLLDK